jgi:hypothetical protein
MWRVRVWAMGMGRSGWVEAAARIASLSLSTATTAATPRVAARDLQLAAPMGHADALDLVVQKMVA